MKRMHEANITPAEFMKEQITEAQQYQVYNSAEFLEKMYQNKQKFFGSGEPTYTLEETLEKFTSENDCEVDDPVKAVDDAGHGEFLRATHEIFIERNDPKKHLVWLYGKRNAGKSTFIKMFEGIFSCQRIQF